MGFLKTCLMGIEPHDTNASIGTAFIPFISADYDHSEPFGYIIMAITGLLIIYNNIALLVKYLFKPKQQFLWAFVLWGNCLFLFQLNLAITKYVNRLQLFIAIVHNMCELTMFYWIYLAIRDYIKCPFCTYFLKSVTICDRAFLWTFTGFAYLINILQIAITALFSDLKYGTYVFYLIFVGDTLFIGGTIICFILVWRRRNIIEIKELTSLLVAVIAHALYAANNVLTCRYDTFTADIALVMYAISVAAVTTSVFCAVRKPENDNTYHPIDSSFDEHMPADTRFC